MKRAVLSLAAAGFAGLAIGLTAQAGERSAKPDNDLDVTTGELYPLSVAAKADF